MPEKGGVILSIYDLSGRVVGRMSYSGTAGLNRIKIQAGNLQSGIYFVEGKYMTKTVVKKFTVIK